MTYLIQTVSVQRRVTTWRPDIRVKHCAYGHSAPTLLNSRGVTTVYYKCRLTVARHEAVLVAVPSIVHCPANYKIKYALFKMKFKSVNELLTLIIRYKLLNVPPYETKSYYNLPFCKRNHLYRSDSNGSKSSYGPVLHSYIWLPHISIYCSLFRIQCLFICFLYESND
jgi:hypothetical protein